MARPTIEQLQNERHYADVKSAASSVKIDLTNAILDMEYVLNVQDCSYRHDEKSSEFTSRVDELYKEMEKIYDRFSEYVNNYVEG